MLWYGFVGSSINWYDINYFIFRFQNVRGGYVCDLPNEMNKACHERVKIMDSLQMRQHIRFDDLVDNIKH